MGSPLSEAVVQGDDANGHRVGTDDAWQQSIIDDAIARGEGPSSFGTIVKGGLAGRVDGVFWNGSRHSKTHRCIEHTRLH